MIEELKNSVKTYFNDAKETLESKSSGKIFIMLIPIALTVIAIWALKIKIWSPKPTKKRTSRRRRYYTRARRYYRKRRRR